MSLSASQWVKPTSIVNAAGLNAKGATLLGGGALLMSASFPVMAGRVVVDLDALDLRQIRLPEVGAQVRLEDLLQDAAFKQGWPAVWGAVTQIASPNVRRLVSVGGSVAAALPGSDLLVALCASSARVQITAADGLERKLLVSDYLAERPAGVITAVFLGEPAHGAYRRLGGRPVPAPAVVTVAAVQHGDAPEIWVGGIGPVPQLRRSEGRTLDVDCVGDAAWPADYRRRVMDTLCAELLAELATGSGNRISLAG